MQIPQHAFEDFMHDVYIARVKYKETLKSVQSG